MRKYLPDFRRCILFERIPEEDLLKTLQCLCVKIVEYKKGQVILREDDAARLFGVVLSGSVNVVSGDLSGNHSILWPVGQGEIFGETYACAQLDALPVSVVASKETRVLLLEHHRVINGCSKGCLAHSYLVTNLLRAIARKNLILNQKMRIVTQRTTREKLMMFLHEQKKKAGEMRFVIPFDRQDLADYLGVERSAMSAELSRMKRDGLIDYRKSEFEILRPLDEAHNEVRHG